MGIINAGIAIDSPVNAAAVIIDTHCNTIHLTEGFAVEDNGGDTIIISSTDGCKLWLTQDTPMIQGVRIFDAVRQLARLPRGVAVPFAN